MNYRTHVSLDPASPLASNAGFFTQEPILGACSNPDRSRRIGFPLGIPLNRLAKGAALLGCALACVQEASAQIGSLTTGTVSNFSVTATSGGTTGTFSYVPTSTGIYTNLTITAGPGTGAAFAVGFGGVADLVGFQITDSFANVTGGGSGSFTMNFTASVLFFDYLTTLSITDSTTVWNVPGLGILSDGQLFNPGSYTFNFTTTHTASTVAGTTEVAGAAAFIPVPETSPQGPLIGGAGVLVAVRSLWRRRSRAKNPPANTSAV